MLTKNLINLITHWCPSNVLSRDGNAKKFCLIVLNQPIKHVDAFHRLWNNATFRFVADGGSNRLYDAFKHDQQKLAQYIPDEIRGDLDSIRPDVRAYYESKSVKITKVSDQDSTDFMKCVALLNEKEKERGQIFDIVATPALGGRFDQTIASINMLYMLKDDIERRFILVSDENLTVLLDKRNGGSSRQESLHQLIHTLGPTCGVMPIGSPATLTTKGLKWDMDNLRCEFGGMVSTSNAVDNDMIEIVTDAPVVWTIEINLLK
ncbi:thiamine pyrophosphokinase [Mucor circinelloides 1006PhL]|uniref:Thiamine pyrophosphokinase n=1 Tax=Mucor circinelloides f. circinelloides (strain 1006PhL) TaxID=1220926 RepID=S2JEW1_MUCC1|nr:thiamine pyrophosphokinase [Mucor circinelloides 1006PhL]